MMYNIYTSVHGVLRSNAVMRYNRSNLKKKTTVDICKLHVDTL